MQQQLSLDPMKLRFAEAPSPLRDFRQCGGDDGKSVRWIPRLPARVRLERQPEWQLHDRICRSVGSDALPNPGETRVCSSLLDERPALKYRSVGQEKGDLLLGGECDVCLCQFPSQLFLAAVQVKPGRKVQGVDHAEGMAELMPQR